MIKLKRIVKDNGFILEEINSEKVNKELIDDGKMEPADLDHVENNPESAQEHIDDVKEIVDKEEKEQEKVALETKTKDYIIPGKPFKESKLFKDRGEMSSFIVKLKEQKIRHRVVPLHEDQEGYKFQLEYEKPLNEQLTESYETAFEVCGDGSKASAVGSFKSTRNYTHELVDFEWKEGTGSGDYRWMNRPWQRFTFAESLREAMINAGVDEKLAKDCIENSYSLKSALKYFAEHCCESKEVKEELVKEEKLNDSVKAKIIDAWHDGNDATVEVLDKNGLSTKSLKEYKRIDDTLWGLCSEDEDFEKYDDLFNGEGITPELDKELNLNGEAPCDRMTELLRDALIELGITEDELDESLKEDKEESKEPKLETFDEQMDFLASDEQEAIDGYEKVLALVEDEHVKAQLEKILEEERAHKEFLEAVKKDPSLEYSHEEHEEDDDIDSFNLEDDEVAIDTKEDDFSWDSLDEDVEEEGKETLDEDLDDDIDSKEKEDDSKEDEEDDDDFKGLNEEIEEITITNENEVISNWDDLED